jgi:hypothetical protein
LVRASSDKTLCLRPPARTLFASTLEANQSPTSTGRSGFLHLAMR